MESQRITESELVLPSLYLMSLKPQGCIKTSELIVLLTQMLKPKGVDAEILSNRSDTFFSQKVRNLKSHDTLSKCGYAKYYEGAYYITESGKKFVSDNWLNIRYLLSSGFSYSDIKNSMGKVFQYRKSKIIPYDEIVSEGMSSVFMSKRYERSSKLRNAAIEHFSRNGIIRCDCCGFEFKSFYGEQYGDSCIEIHHMKPIFQYSSKNTTKTIEDALKNLLPVCPNCHRVIHKNHITIDLLPSFKENIVCNKPNEVATSL